MADQQIQLEPLSPEAEQLELLPQAEPVRQYCIFRAGRERFCFSVLDVEEVVEWPNLTRVPLAPAFLMGIFNLRGSIAPVVDIALTEGRRADLHPKHVVVDEAPIEMPHCCGMLRHEDRMALALNLKKVTETFPVPVI